MSRSDNNLGLPKAILGEPGFPATITKNIKRIAKAADGLYHIGDNTYVKCFGTREEVWNGAAYKTSGELLKADLMINKKGKLVSKSKFLHESVTDRFATVNGTG